LVDALLVHLFGLVQEAFRDCLLQVVVSHKPAGWGVILRTSCLDRGQSTIGGWSMSHLEHVLPAIVFLPFVVAIFTLLVGRLIGRQAGWLMVLSSVTAFAGSLWLFIHQQVQDRVAPVFTFAWLPDLNIHLNLRADPFGLFFAMLIAGIGVLVGIYSLGYIPRLATGRIGRYYAALIGFMGSMLGIALADDLFLLFVFWEVTSITSFLLIGFWYEQGKARKGALTALQITALGGLAMMAGFVLVGEATGTYQISILASQEALQQQLAASPLFTPALLLVFVGAFTKSAQVPFHFWLPNAMVAPTPVSTYLHAATMVKAGVFLVGRMLPIFNQSAYWSPILITVGLFTFFLGAYQAFRENDLKGMLARTTISSLGLVMMIYGLNAASQDALQIFNHAAYKGTLFLVVGIVEHATHTRDIRKLGGLRKKMPIVFVLCLLAGLSMAGLPPFFGFIAKETLYAELLHNDVLHNWPYLQWFVIGTCVLANAFIFAVSFRLICGVFLGPLSDKARDVHTPCAFLWIPPAVLAVVMVAVGISSAWPLTQNLVNMLSSDVHAEARVSLFPSADHLGPLILSCCTIGIGILIFKAREVVGQIQRQFDFFPEMQTVWDEVLNGVTWFAECFTRYWQNGSMRWYFSGILLFFVGLSILAISYFRLSFDLVPISLSQMPWSGFGLCILLVITVVTVVVARTRLGAAIALTATGFLVALIFVVYRSPDILLTQILIESVSTIFILLILFYMPSFKKDRLRPAQKMLNLGISCAVGVTMFIFVLFATSLPFRETKNLAGEYLSRAFHGAGGQNAVNVIIVDFRAVDTMGEITVLVVVGLCVFGLLRTRRRMRL